MAEITASIVKELREKTGAGMMECKKALTETNGDLNAAIDFLRKKGLSVAEKKAGRVAAQGLVAVKANGNQGAVIEVNSETDFVAKNPEFQAFVSKALDAVFNGGDLEAEKAELVNLIAKIGENMSIRRFEKLSVNQGAVVSYVHSAVVPNMGKIGVIVALESDKPADELNALGKQIAMHIAANNPLFKEIADVDPNAVAHEKEIFTEQAKASGKPENIIEKMVEGRIKKYYNEVVLVEQPFVMDPDKKVADILGDVKIADFVRFGLGEGIEKKEEDFAAEVSKQLAK